MAIARSRYYIPSGRSIQKPYVNGDLEDYYNELYERGEHGEFFSADSIHAEQGKAFKTMGGRTVYGGGGITPDVFVPRDTSHVSTYLFELYNKNVIREYALHYANVHEAELKKQSVDSFVRNFEISEAMCNEIVKEANKVGVKHDPKGFAKSKPFIQNQVKALIARAVWKDENGLSNSFYKVVNTDDEAIKVALKSFGKAEKLEGK
ncbi:hypothetical protein LAG90_12855 [Marinilongibacter aquaticus]|uniref:hypothetical protein n=1 Tax=Marinilongibacter aquaticus TaxID=2975157 RepID=UPI0021BDC508|nr:hypothetical protein [Marinilongibacter aquaticus]UBM57702.1 hypothetical protein LAG90_12855 [Marinilongibacter aquaticus]